MFSTGRGAVGVIALLALCVTVRGINRDRQQQRQSVAGAEQCSTPAVVGDVSSTTAVNRHQLLGFGRNFNVAVVVDGCPPGTHHAGSRLVACDHDVAPKVVWFNTKRGHVLRTGNPSQVGLATVTVFCNPGSWDDDVRATVDVFGRSDSGANVWVREDSGGRADAWARGKRSWENNNKNTRGDRGSGTNVLITAAQEGEADAWDRDANEARANAWGGAADNRDATEGRDGRPGRSVVVAEAVQASDGEASNRGQ